MADSTVSALSTSVPGVPGAMDLTIDPDDVLKVAKIINDQADALADRVNQSLGALTLEPPAQDVVSATAVDAWNRLVAHGDGSYAARVRHYIEQLRKLATQLRKAAETYQAGEDEKVAALGDRHAAER
ncbi:MULTISPECIES: PE domain-containing protein [Amycolatopsis]|uniref:PE family protein n=2 Tax=Amycolatopsis TaxID=1813 RepID=A0A1I3TR06_9PSEU|nr:PE domain-containing protein [Amycolatopsis sacchari]SFJ73235.1 PE family protein [Amycolatopsis sacchari]